MFRWFKNVSKRNLNELTNDELADMGAEFTEDGERALTILRDRQKELVNLYQMAYSEFERKNYSLTVKYINNYVSLAEKYGVVVISSVFDLLIGVAKECGEPEAVFSVYDDTIAYYTQVVNKDSVTRFERDKERYKASLK